MKYKLNLFLKLVDEFENWCDLVSEKEIVQNRNLIQAIRIFRKTLNLELKAIKKGSLV